MHFIPTEDLEQPIKLFLTDGGQLTGLLRVQSFGPQLTIMTRNNLTQEHLGSSSVLLYTDSDSDNSQNLMESKLDQDPSSVIFS